MKAGRSIPLIASSTILMWHVLVVAINAVGAIHQHRWIDASVWLAEDPLSPLALWLGALIFGNAGSDQAIMYTAEAIAVLLWSTVAFVVYVFLRKLTFSSRLNELSLSPFVVISLSIVTLLVAYSGGFIRFVIPDLPHTQNGKLAQILALMTFLGIANAPILVFSVVAAFRLPGKHQVEL